jgi:hypothetical protein
MFKVGFNKHHFWVPKGNTGGANVNLLKLMPVLEDLNKIMTQ